MKKLFGAILLFAFFLPVVSSAQTLDTTADPVLDATEEADLTPDIEVTQIGDVTEEDLGLLPDSFFYPMKSWWEEVQLFFAFSDEKKADLELKFANRRLLELKKLCEDKDNCELAEKLAPKFQNRIERVIQRVEKADQNGKDTEAIIEKLKENLARQQDVLQGVYDKVPEPAKEAILNAMEKSTEGLTNAIEKIQGTAEADQFQNTVKNRVKNYGDEVKVKIKERLNFYQDQESNSNNDADEEQNQQQNTNTGNTGEDANQNQAGQN